MASGYGIGWCSFGPESGLDTADRAMAHLQLMKPKVYFPTVPL